MTVTKHAQRAAHADMIEVYFVAQVPIQKLPAARPAPAGRAQFGASSQHHAHSQSAGQPSKARKRAKQVAGAGTILLALFSFVVFLGPLGPLAGPRLSGSAPFLPGSESMVSHTGSGRVLMAVGSNSSDDLDNSLPHNRTALELPVYNFLPVQVVAPTEGSDESLVADNFSDQGKVVSRGWGGGRVMEAGHVAPFKSVVLRPSNKKAEVQALQGLKVTSVPSTATDMPAVDHTLQSCHRIVSVCFDVQVSICTRRSAPRVCATKPAALYASVFSKLCQLRSWVS